MNKKLLSGLPFAIIILVLILGVVTPAGAVPPDIFDDVLEPITYSGCGYDVYAEDPFLNLTGHVFYDQEGDFVRFMSTGTTKTRLTNVDTGEYVEVNLSGNFVVNPQPDGTTIVSLNGQTLILFDGFEELPAMSLIVGRVDILEPGGPPEIVSLRGNVWDLCAELAP